MEVNGKKVYYDGNQNHSLFLEEFERLLIDGGLGYAMHSGDGKHPRKVSSRASVKERNQNQQQIRTWEEGITKAINKFRACHSPGIRTFIDSLTETTDMKERRHLKHLIKEVRKRYDRGTPENINRYIEVLKQEGKPIRSLAELDQAVKVIKDTNRQLAAWSTLTGRNYIDHRVSESQCKYHLLENIAGWKEIEYLYHTVERNQDTYRFDEMTKHLQEEIGKIELKRTVKQEKQKSLAMTNPLLTAKAKEELYDDTDMSANVIQQPLSCWNCSKLGHLAKDCGVTMGTCTFCKKSWNSTNENGFHVARDCWKNPQFERYRQLMQSHESKELKSPVKSPTLQKPALSRELKRSLPQRQSNSSSPSWKKPRPVNQGPWNPQQGGIIHNQASNSWCYAEPWTDAEPCADEEVENTNFDVNHDD